MTRLTAYLLTVALGVFAALTLVACGKKDAQLLPGETAREITANLDTVNQLAEEGDCIGAESAAEQVSEQIEAIAGVDAKLKQALQDGATRLNEVVDECDEAPEEAVGPASIPVEPEEEEEEKPAKGPSKENKPDKAKEKPVPPEEPATPTPPTEPEGEEGNEEGETEFEESPSGGVSPGSPVEGGD